MPFDDNYSDYESESEYDARSSVSGVSEVSGESYWDFVPAYEKIHAEESDIEYLTRDELMAKLRENMSGYISEMQQQMTDDMRVIAALNARAASSADPAMTAMYMTVASELAESMKTRLEIEVDTNLAEILHDRKYVHVGDNEICAIPQPEGGSSQKYYVLKGKNGSPVKSYEQYEELMKKLQKPVYAANDRRIEAEQAFFEKFGREERWFDAHSEETAPLTDRKKEIDPETETKFTKDLRENFRGITYKYAKEYSKVFTNLAFLDRCENLRHIARAMLGGDSSLEPHGIQEDLRTETTVATMAYLTEKARNALDLAADGAAVNKSYSRLNREQLEILKNRLEANPEHSAVYFKNQLEDRFEVLSESKTLGAEDNSDLFTRENAAIGLCIFSDRGENIRVSDFIKKVNSGAELTEEERGWACRQFDLMAEQSGANIRGMYVNGRSVFTPDDYYENQQENEVRAKCEVIAAALDGQRIAAVPVKDGFPVESKPVPVLTIDMVEPTLTLWEKILAFFGYGRSVRMREANSLDEYDRAYDEQYISQDIAPDSKRAAARERNDKLNATREKVKELAEALDARNKPESRESVSEPESRESVNEAKSRESVKKSEFVPDSRSLQLKTMAENAMNARQEAMERVRDEFFGNLYPELGKNNTSANIGFKIGEELSYTNSDGENSMFLATLNTREMSRTYFMCLYGMTKGYSMDEMVNSPDIDRGAIAKEFMEKFSIKKLDKFAEEHGMAADSEEARKSYNEYVIGKKQALVKLSTEMFEALKTVEYTAPDPSDPESFIRGYAANKTYFMMLGDFVQAFGSIRGNDLDPSNPGMQEEADRTGAINDYEYFKLMPLQSYAAAYDKYMNFISGESILDPGADPDGFETDMAARSKRFFECAVDWTKGKKTWGDIIDDKKVADNIGCIAPMCYGDDDYFDNNVVGEINQRYLHSTDKNFGYIEIDTESHSLKRVGLSLNNGEFYNINKMQVEDSEKRVAEKLPAGFEKNLTEAFDKVIGQEKKKEAPVREKMDFSELLGSSPKRVERRSSTSSLQREQEKTMGGRSNK